MSKLFKVTISGADDKVKIDDLIAISKRFPFVEWAILVAPKNHGKLRYPTVPWITEFGSADVPCQKALHLCGDYARFFTGITKGGPGWNTKDLLDMIDDFDRVQINLSGQLNDIDINLTARNIFESLVHDWIIQLKNDGNDSREFLDKINVATRKLNPVFSIYPFLDASGGHGVEAKEWKMDLCIRGIRGYAGGINPSNVKSVLNSINSSLLEGEKFWIDMESGIRTNDEFDLKLVQDVLKICEPHISVG